MMVSKLHQDGVIYQWESYINLYNNNVKSTQKKLRTNLGEKIIQRKGIKYSCDCKFTIYKPATIILFIPS